MTGSLPPLGDLEHELLVMLRRLEEKGYVTHAVVSGAFIYQARETAESTAASAVRGVVERFCGGSLERALLGLVEAGFVDVNQLAKLVGKLKRKPR